MPIICYRHFNPMTFTPLSALFLFPAIIFMIHMGRRFRRNHPPASESSAVEGAVFALFGLLLALTFSGAIGRYDDHRKLFVEEANDIGTAYLRLDLLPAPLQPALRQSFHKYASIRAHAFDGLPESPQSVEALRQTDLLLADIWSHCVAATLAPNDAKGSPDAAKLLLPAVNAMIDITATQKNAFDMHPPSVVFGLLYAFSLICAFLAGYSMSTSAPWLYTFALAFTVTLTIHATLDVEYPRRGLIHLTTQHTVFDNLENSMK